MADHILERRFWLPRARPDVFEFFADPRNLAAVNPPSTRLRWLAPPPERLAAGAVLDCREYDVGHKLSIAGIRDLRAWWRPRR